MTAPATLRPVAHGSLLVAAVTLFGACGGGSAQPLRVTRVYLVVPAGTSAAALYFTIVNDGASADTLTSVSTPAGATAELHETVAGTTGTMTMTPLSLVDVPAHAVTPFAPGGRHVMLTSPHAGLKRGDTVSVTFVFMGRGQVRTRAAVIAYADVDTATAARSAPPPP